MASSYSSGGGKSFPLQLATGVMEDLLSKELDAVLFPANTAKQAAFAAARQNLSRRLALLMPQIEETSGNEAADGFLQLELAMWQFLSSHPSLLSIQPSALQSSLWLETMTSIFKVACAAARHATGRGQLLQGGRLVISALFGVGPSGRSFSAERAAQLVTLVSWWGDEVCSKRFGVKDAWGFYDLGGRPYSPLHAITTNGLVWLVPLAVAKGCPVNGDFRGKSSSCPAAEAFEKADLDVVEALLAHGLDIMHPYEGDGWQLALSLFAVRRGDRRRWAAFLANLLHKHPAMVHLSTSAKASTRYNLLEAALLSKDPAVVDLVLTAGAPLEYGFRVEGHAVVINPSIAASLGSDDSRIVNLLITKGKALQDWHDKYDMPALCHISSCLAGVAASAYPSNPRYEGPLGRLQRYNPQAKECVELVLASGFVQSWTLTGHNSLLLALYVRDEEGIILDCVLEDKHALALLKRFRSAGFEVVERAAPQPSCTELKQGCWRETTS